jgi:hypothetical protein
MYARRRKRHLKELWARLVRQSAPRKLVISETRGALGQRKVNDAVSSSCSPASYGRVAFPNACGIP